MKKPKGFSGSLLIWIALFIAVFAISQLTYLPDNIQKSDTIPYSQFVEKVNGG